MNWKGGRIKRKDGYIYLYAKGHPFATKNGGNYVLEHRLVMEKYLGRYLTKHEVVDHINGIKNDNRLENLRLFVNHGEHIREEHQRGKYKEHLKNLEENNKHIYLNNWKFLKRNIKNERFISEN